MSDLSVTFEPERVSIEALAHLGEGHIAYVKQVRSEDVPGLFPQAPDLAPGIHQHWHVLARLQSPHEQKIRPRWRGFHRL